MKHTQHRFQQSLDAEFFQKLTKRVRAYFEDNELSPEGRTAIFAKSIFMMAIFLLPYFALFMWPGIPAAGFLGLWVLMGIGVAAIGVNIMHDANHGVFSKNKKINNIVRLVMNLLGGDASIWRLQHNVLHHTYTNIHGADEDIIGPPLLRFSPHDRQKKVHRAQFIYAWPLYGMMTLIKVFYTDYMRAFRYRRMNLIKSQKEFRMRLLKITLGKLLYFAYILLLPLIFTEYSPLLIISGFLIMHLVTGIILSIIFQTAHVMPDTEFPLPDSDGKMNNNWAVHQMLTTTNFSPKSRIFSWFIGGLNFQVEHHLFSHISHVHYRKLSAIVRQTAQEAGIPYHCEKNFATAVSKHAKMLYQLGR